MESGKLRVSKWWEMPIEEGIAGNSRVSLTGSPEEVINMPMREVTRRNSLGEIWAIRGGWREDS